MLSALARNNSALASNSGKLTGFERWSARRSDAKQSGHRAFPEQGGLFPETVDQMMSTDGQALSSAPQFRVGGWAFGKGPPFDQCGFRIEGILPSRSAGEALFKVTATGPVRIGQCGRKIKPTNGVVRGATFFLREENMQTVAAFKAQDAAIQGTAATRIQALVRGWQERRHQPPSWPFADIGGHTPVQSDSSSESDSDSSSSDSSSDSEHPSDDDDDDDEAWGSPCSSNDGKAIQVFYADSSVKPLPGGMTHYSDGESGSDTESEIDSEHSSDDDDDELAPPQIDTNIRPIVPTSNAASGALSPVTPAQSPNPVASSAAASSSFAAVSKKRKQRGGIDLVDWDPMWFQKRRRRSATTRTYSEMKGENNFKKVPTVVHMANSVATGGGVELAVSWVISEDPEGPWRNI